MKRVPIAHSQAVISSSPGVSAPTVVSAQRPQGPLGPGEPQPGAHRSSWPGAAGGSERPGRGISLCKEEKKNVTRSHLPFSREGRGSPSGLPTPSCASEEMRDELIRIIIIIKKKIKNSLRFVFLLLRLRPSLSAQDGTVVPLCRRHAGSTDPAGPPEPCGLTSTAAGGLGPGGRGLRCAGLRRRGGLPGGCSAACRGIRGRGGQKAQARPRQRGSCVRAPGKETKREN